MNGALVEKLFQSALGIEMEFAEFLRAAACLSEFRRPLNGDLA
jgi:hypothetical protein